MCGGAIKGTVTVAPKGGTAKVTSFKERCRGEGDATARALLTGDPASGAASGGVAPTAAPPSAFSRLLQSSGKHLAEVEVDMEMQSPGLAGTRSYAQLRRGSTRPSPLIRSESVRRS